MISGLLTLTVAWIYDASQAKEVKRACERPHYVKPDSPYIWVNPIINKSSNLKQWKEKYSNRVKR